MTSSSIRHTTEGFVASGLNDATRIDISAGKPFLAVDGVQVHERDDAFRIKTLETGGFLVQIAIADTSQIPYEGQLVERAMARGDTRYFTRSQYRSMLPGGVRHQLELNSKHGVQRAMIVEADFNLSAEQRGAARIFPGLVRVLELGFGELSKYCLEVDGGESSPIIALDRALALRRNKVAKLPIALGGILEDDIFGHKVVEHFMRHTNEQYLLNATDEGLPFFIPAPRWHGHKAEIPQLCLPDSDTTTATRTTFTSPLRRVTDLANHALFGAHLAGASTSEVVAIAEQLSGAMAKRHP